MSMILSITTDRKPGGIATALQSYSRALLLRGHQHCILLPPGSPAIDSLSRLEGVTLVVIAAAMIRFHLATRGLFSRRLRAAIAAADALFIHNSRLAGPVRSFRKPVILFSHSGKLRHIGAADHLVVLSNAARARADAKCAALPGATPPQLHIIPHGFATASVKSRPANPQSALKVMAAGRFVQKKGFEVLLATAALLEARNIPVQFDIFGEGPIGPVLTHQARQLNLKTVNLHGWQPDLASKMDSFDLFCLPSNEEPFGLVIGETMGRGVPMVATMTDGPMDVLGHTGMTPETTLAAGGLLVATGDAAAMADAIAFFAQDRAALDAAGQAAHRRITSDFGMPVLADRLDRLIQAVRSPGEASLS